MRFALRLARACFAFVTLVTFDARGDATSEVASIAAVDTDTPTVVWSLSAKASYLSPPIRGATSPFGAGFGGVIGLTIADIYVAISILDFLGGSDVTLSDRALFYGVEAGYNLGLVRVGNGKVVLRPGVGAGVMSVYHTDPSTAKVDVVTSASGQSSSNTTSDTTTISTAYVEPKIALLYTADWHFFGATGSMVYVPSISYGGAADSSAWLSYSVSAEIGVRF